MSAASPSPGPLGLVCNPRARSERRDPGLRDRLGALLGARGRVVTPDTPAALEAALAALRDEGCTTIALHGGDGTGHRVVTALFDVWGDAALPEVLWLHGGTNNTASRSMGQVGRAEAQLAAWVAAAEGGPALGRTQRWPLCVEGDRRGFLWGVGVVERFIDAYEAGGDASVARAGWTLLRAVGSAFTGGAFAEAFFAPIGCAVEADGVPWPDLPWVMVTAGAVTHIGLDFQPFPRVLDHPGRLHALGTAATPRGLAADLPRLYRGRPPADDRRVDVAARSLTLRSDRPLRYDLDGDLYTARDTTLTVHVDRPLTFLIAPPGRPVHVAGP